MTAPAPEMTLDCICPGDLITTKKDLDALTDEQVLEFCTALSRAGVRIYVTRAGDWWAGWAGWAEWAE